MVDKEHGVDRRRVREGRQGLPPPDSHVGSSSRREQQVALDDGRSIGDRNLDESHRSASPMGQHRFAIRGPDVLHSSTVLRTLRPDTTNGDSGRSPGVCGWSLRCAVHGPRAPTQPGERAGGGQRRSGDGSLSPPGSACLRDRALSSSRLDPQFNSQIARSAQHAFGQQHFVGSS